MKKRSQLIIAAIATALMAQMTASASLVLLNGGIDDNGDATLEQGGTEGNWTAAADNVVNCYMWAAAHHEGLYGLELRENDPTVDNTVYQKLGTTEAGESDITFSAWFSMLDSLQSDDMSFGLYTDAAGTTALAEQDITLTTTFTQYSVQATGVAVGTDVYAVFTYRDNAAVAQNRGFVDTMALTVVPEPATLGMLGLGALVTLLIRRKVRS